MNFKNKQTTGNEKILNQKRKIDKQKNKIAILHLYYKNKKLNAIRKNNKCHKK